MKTLRLHFTPETIRHKHLALLYRTFALVCLLTLVCAPMLLAQRQRNTLRALGLLELAPGGHARLVPVGILVDGKWYDASIYRADPRPMALDPGTVYEAEHSGGSLGLFTVTNTANFKEVWVGLGQWRTDAMLAQARKEKPKKGASANSISDPNDRRPTLKRSDSENETKTPASANASTAPPNPNASTGSAATQEAESSPADADDSDRPILRRGKPTPKQEADEIPPVTVQKPGAGNLAGSGARAGATPASQIQVLPAISDAGGPQPRSYAIKVSDSDRSAFEQQARGLAYQAIQKFAANHRLHKPGAASALEENAFNIFDLQRNGEPAIVFSASLPEMSGMSATATPAAAGDFEYYVTVVAQRDLYGNVNQLFAHVTDSTNLDVFPQMELIDAVDAEGVGSGQLLFRLLSDTGYRYAVYRAGMNKLSEIFVSASRSF